MAFAVAVVVVPRLLPAAAGGSTMATIDDPEESDDGEEARVVKSSTPPAAAGAAALEGEGRGFLITEKPKAVRSTKLVMAPPLPGGEGRLVEELVLFRSLMIALSS